MARIPDVQKLLRDDIVSGAIPFGARLRIDDLAGRYGVSHMPVREALRALSGTGLVVLEPNRGASVRTVHMSFVIDLFDIRSAVETMLARRASERRTAEHLRDLNAAQDMLEQRVASDDFLAVPHANNIFHGVINEAAGNPGALSMVDRNWLLVAAIWQRYGYDEGRFHGVIDDHRHIIRAIERQDAGSAATLMGAHIEKAKHDLLARIAVDPKPDIGRQ
ncbi:GntR family transcriptional regulator [Mesorhizobium sp. B1-1-1]|uniref:GntR family transcriptional regulator n=1 Tax=Mesorhizobium sp. B1-1-1 TaxID=2589983 RepID=UPI00112B23EC|nr:GntR family transcriptional regulator [Mesorhizobium sp. B1-1-1]TPN66065.1 GntR family transcriptional regulator [Mesorhizobium sp. B1-1-1]